MPGLPRGIGKLGHSTHMEGQCVTRPKDAVLSSLVKNLRICQAACHKKKMPTAAKTRRPARRPSRRRSTGARIRNKLNRSPPKFQRQLFRSCSRLYLSPALCRVLARIQSAAVFLLKNLTADIQTIGANVCLSFTFDRRPIQAEKPRCLPAE